MRNLVKVVQAPYMYVRVERFPVLEIEDMLISLPKPEWLRASLFHVVLYLPGMNGG
jgi:hypothetical protein